MKYKFYVFIFYKEIITYY